MRLMTAIGCLVLLGACQSTPKTDSPYTYKDTFTYQQMTSLHYQQSGSDLGYRYESGPLINEHNKHWPAYAKTCRDLMAEEGKVSFQFIFVVDSNGDVIDARSPVKGKAASCFLTAIKKITYPSPPFEYWYELVNVR